MEVTEKNFEKCFVVLGAGASGLATAFKLLQLQDKPVVLIEKNDKPGGLSGSFHWKNCVIDYGPHRFSTAIPEMTKFVQDLLGEDMLELNSKHMVMINKNLYQFPPRISDFLQIRLINFVIKSGFSLLYTKIKHLIIKLNDETFNLIIESRFGTYFKDNIVDQMVEKVWPGETKEMDKRFAQIRFKVISISELVRSTLRYRRRYNPKVSLYPRYGYTQIFDEMLNKMRSYPNFEYFSNSSVIEVDTDTPPGGERLSIKSLVIKTTNGLLKISSSNLAVISSIPVSSLCHLLKFTISHKLEIVSLRLYLFLINQPRTLNARTYIFPQTSIKLNRVFEQNQYSRDTVPENKSLLVGDLSFPLGFKGHIPTVQEIYEELQLNKIIDPRKFWKLSNNKMKSQEKSTLSIEMDYRDIEYAYLRPSLQNYNTMREIHDKLATVNNLFLLGRFGAGVYNNADFAIASGFKLAEYLTLRNRTVDTSQSWNQHHNIFG